MAGADDARRFGEERQDAIVARLAREGRVVSAALAKELGVSVDTVRRDLLELEVAGAVKRVHGGAVRALRGEARFLERLRAVAPGQATLARLGAELIEDGEVVAIGGGTTTLLLARALAPGLQATVVTASLDVALELRGRSGVSVDVLGGRLDRESQTLTGVGTVEQLRGLRPDTCVISPCGLDVTEGLTLRERDEAQVVAAMVSRSRRTIVLAAAAKLESAGPYVVAEAAAIDVLVTDAREERCAAFRALGIEVVAG